MLEDWEGRRLDPLAQRFVQAVARHDIRFPAKDAGRAFPHIHQREETEFSFFVVDEQIDIRILPRLAARGGAEQVQMLDPEMFQFGLVGFQPGDGGVAVHAERIARMGAVAEGKSCSPHPSSPCETLPRDVCRPMAGQSHPSNRTVRIMREIQASEARTQLSQLLDEVERGKTLVITRHGRPIAPEAHPRWETSTRPSKSSGH